MPMYRLIFKPVDQASIYQRCNAINYIDIILRSTKIYWLLVLLLIKL
jgi:hypothetical protein